MRHNINVHPELHLAVLLVGFYVFTSLFMPREGHVFDMISWSDWIIYMKQHGIRRIYDLHTHPEPGKTPSFLYGPVYMYLLYFLGKWQGAVEQIKQNTYQVKIMILIFDVVGVWFALRYLRDKIDRPFYALFLLFNISLMYNTISWGQVDGALACLALVAVYYALRGQLALSAIPLIIALLIKPQPIVFLPILGLLWLTTVLKKPAAYTALNFLSVVLVLFILLFPFLQAGTLVNYWSMLRDSASVYPAVTVNAGNVWNLLLTDDPNKVSDELIKLGLSYKQWGLLLFSAGYFIILFPLLRQFYAILRGKRLTYDPSMVLLSVGLVPIVFYFFNTQMHERYAHLSVLLLGAYGLSKGDFVPYVVASIANFWVMEKYLKFFGLHRLYEYVTLEQVAILFLIVLIWGVVQLYRKGVLVEPEIALV